MYHHIGDEADMESLTMLLGMFGACMDLHDGW